mmetsp:Transcript_1365/g.1787  ORF Transcript_1365/g.1787 Transcript_1365/m.1787 type:complete len:93 (-) Transcript_1365:23-301(-)
MKHKERDEMNPLMQVGFSIFLFFIWLQNQVGNGMIDHLNKRGVLTSYWVVNDDDEVQDVMTQTPALAVMTDKPSNVARIYKESRDAAENKDK